MNKNNLIRTAAFSHSEPFLTLKGGGESKYQVVIRIDEDWFDESKVSDEKLKKENRPGKFICEVTCFNLTTGTTEFNCCPFLNLKEALNRVSQVFAVFNEFSAPVEHLFLPQWRNRIEIDDFFGKWCDGLFGQENAIQG